MDKNKLPRHIAIIMDGNGRWAKKHHLPVIFGHRTGAKSVDKITEECARLGIEALTLYSFSMENWKRPKEEVEGLMNLLCDYLDKKLNKLQKNKIRLNAIGRLDELPEKVRAKLFEVMEKTAANKRMVLTLALNYSARQEIIDAARSLVKMAQEKNIDPEGIDEKLFSRLLYTKGLPDPDLLIRTSGEMRLSNFLLWQLSYAEIVISKALWPDFSPSKLRECILEYQSRDRRFGAR